MDTIATVKPNELQNVVLLPTAGWPQQTDSKLSIDDTSQGQKLSPQHPLIEIKLSGGVTWKNLR